jgi:subtilisin family serine protease
MIVMSFGFESPIDIIDSALRNATQTFKEEGLTRTRTLIFAATRNDGANKDVAWPARSHDVIGISSTDGNGEISSFNPPDDRSHSIFYALGEAVEVCCPPHMKKRNNTTRMSGTSFANPIAAGLAAIVLGYVKMAASRNFESSLDLRAVLKRLRTMDGMKAILQHRMNRGTKEGWPRIIPWDWLKKERHGRNVILNEIWETLKHR